jgi:hypothetical protein
MQVAAIWQMLCITIQPAVIPSLQITFRVVQRGQFEAFFSLACFVCAYWWL